MSEKQQWRPRIYVAAASVDVGLARVAMNAVRAAGAEVTSDWTSDVERDGSQAEGCADRELRSDAMLRAVAESDALLFVVPARNTTEGAYAELGCAWGALVPAVAWLPYPYRGKPFAAAWIPVWLEDLGAAVSTVIAAARASRAHRSTPVVYEATGVSREPGGDSASAHPEATPDDGDAQGAP